MRRPFVPISIALAAGVLIGHSISIPVSLVFSLLIAALPLFAFFRKRPGFDILLLISFLLLGVLSERGSSRLPPNDLAHFPYEGRMTIEGIVKSLPEIKAKNGRFLQSFELSAESVFFKPDLYRMQGRAQVFLHHVKTPVRYGDRVRLWGDLREVPEARNPGEFDYKAYLLSRGMTRMMQVFGERSVRVLSRGHGHPFLSRVFDARTKIKQAIDRSVSFPENEILSALLIGIRKHIPEGIREEFVKTGTAHVLAVSGLNISIVGGLFYWALRRAKVPQKLNAILSLLFIASYVLISGYNAPVLRAGIMGALLLGGLLLERESDTVNSLAIAFFVLLLFRPANLFTASFQLSFLTVLTIVIWMPRVQEQWLIPKSHGVDPEASAEEKKLRRKVLGIRFFFANLFWGTLVAFLGSFPLVIYYFHIAAPITLVANLFIVPLTNLSTFAGVVLLPVLLVNPSWSHFLVVIPEMGIRLALGINHFLSRIPGASFYVAKPSCLVLWVYYGILVLLAVERKKWRRFLPLCLKPLLAVLGLAAALLSFTFQSRPPLQIDVLDIAKAPVLFFEFPEGGNLLLNAGREKPRDDGRWMVKPFLMSRGIQRLSTVLISSYRKRDMGGVFSVVEEFPIGHFFLPPFARTRETQTRLLDRLQEKRIPSRFLREGDQIEGFGKVAIDFPFVGDGLLMRLRYGETSLWVVAAERGEGGKKSLSAMNFGASFDDTKERDLFRGPVRALVWFRERGEWEAGELELLHQIKPNFLILVGAGETPREYKGAVFTTARHGAIKIEGDGRRFSIFPFLKK